MTSKLLFAALSSIALLPAGAAPAILHPVPQQKIIFDYEPMRDDNGKAIMVDGEPVNSYVPKNARATGNAMIETRIDVIVSTRPAVRDAWIGDLVSSTKSEKAIPPHVITDHEGRFHATIIGKKSGAEGEWGTFSVVTPKSHDAGVTMESLQRENSAAIEQLRKQDAPTTVALAFEPVVFYDCDENSSHKNTIVSFPAFRFQIPRIANEEFQNVEEITHEKVALTYLDRRDPDHDRSVICPLPGNVKQLLKSVTDNKYSSYMWYSQRNTYLLEDGVGCIRYPKDQTTVYTAPPGTTLESVSAFPRGKILMMLVTRGNTQLLQGIDLSTRKAVWEFAVPGGMVSSRIIWASDRFAVSAYYGRKVSGYDVIDIVRRKIVKSGTFDGDLTIEKQSLYLLDRDKGGRKLLYNFH